MPMDEIVADEACMSDQDVRLFVKQLTIDGISTCNYWRESEDVVA